jgi:hypothetical protein
MGAFKQYNGKSGFDAIFHTATGYKCRVRPCSPEDQDKEIYFFAKHIVGKDGRPYTEIGFESDESYNSRDFMERSKAALKNYGFEEVLAITNCKQDEMAFCEYASPLPNTIEIRANAGKDGILKVFEALGELVSEHCVDFIRDQEEDVEENLYLSILFCMGDELKRGPGGEKMAQKRARSMAETFLNGYQLN